MNKNTKVMLGVFAVAAAGVGIGMLLAKSKGEEARTTKKCFKQFGGEGKKSTNSESPANS